MHCPSITMFICAYPPEVKPVLFARINRRNVFQFLRQTFVYFETVTYVLMSADQKRVNLQAYSLFSSCLIIKDIKRTKKREEKA